jgi:cell division protein FtsQ
MSRFQAVERPQPGGRDPFRRTRNAHLHRNRRRMWLRRGVRGLLFTAVTLGLAATVGIGGWRWMQATPVFAIDHIRVEGLQRSDPADLRLRLAPWRGSNLLAVNLGDVRRLAMKAPWVRDASVRRVLPDTLAVRVSERRPVAMTVTDGVLTMVDRSGTAITTWDRRLTGVDMPLLTGLDGLDPDARAAQVRSGLDILDRLARYDAGLVGSLSEIDLSRGDRVTVRLTNEPAPLYLSREDITVNLDHYLALRGDIRTRVPAVDAVDLRWRGRVVVVPQSDEIAGNERKDG